MGMDYIPYTQQNAEAFFAQLEQWNDEDEYTRRAFLNGKLSLTQAEAVMDIISADGRQGAALANASGSDRLFHGKGWKSLSSHGTAVRNTG